MRYADVAGYSHVAARLEALAEPGGICVSQAVRTAVGTRLALDYEFMGEQRVKNIAEPVRAYHARPSGQVRPRAIAPSQLRRQRAAGVVAVVAIPLFVVAGVVAWRAFEASRIEVASVERMALPLPEKPSIAVLPFDNLSGDASQDYLADGMTEDIISHVSQIERLFVIARNSTFVYKNRPVKVQEVAEELGVRYVLEGSVQKAGERLRITAQLIDALTGRHMWSERFDRDETDLFILQDEIADRIVVALQVELTEGEQIRVWRGHSPNLDAWRQVAKGVPRASR